MSKLDNKHLLMTINYFKLNLSKLNKLMKELLWESFNLKWLKDSVMLNLKRLVSLNKFLDPSRLSVKMLKASLIAAKIHQLKIFKISRLLLLIIFMILDGLIIWHHSNNGWMKILTGYYHKFKFIENLRRLLFKNLKIMIIKISNFVKIKYLQ